MADASPFWRAPDPLLLASTSLTRRALLEAAAIPIETAAPHVDEPAIAASLLTEGHTPPEIATALAHAKSEAVARRFPDRLILAADQMLEFDGRLLFKPGSRAEAALRLGELRGRTHRLHSAAVLRQGETLLWAGLAVACLSMRAFGDPFLAAYLSLEGDAVLASVGAYRIEGPGLHLFEAISGDHATILGLPLLPVLHALRDCGALAA